MKSKSASHLVLTGLFIILAFALCNSSARADCRETTWTGHGDGRDWFDRNNWDNCVPDHNVDASINNAGTAVVDHQVNNGGATARSLTLGANQGDSGQVSVEGAYNFLADFPRCENGVPVPGAGDIYVGKAGSGTLHISSGAAVYTGHAYIAAVANPVRPASNGAVIVKGEDSAWVVFGDECRGDTGLFIGCTATTDGGGTALLSVGDGAIVIVSNGVNNPADAQQAIKLGLSGTLTGNGFVEMLGPGRLARTMTVLGTLQPSGTLTVYGNITLISKATTLCNVTPQAWDSIELSAEIPEGNSDGGFAILDGRLTVIMTGDFRSGPTRFTLLHAQSGIDPNTKFGSESIKYPTDQGFKPKITYDYVGNHVYLDLVFDH